MNFHLVHLSDVAPVPWRNGGGVTRELAVSPAEGDWRWRMSVAEVEASGPFSRFDGIDRWFAVLEGEGVLLDVQGQAQRVTQDSAPFYFDGGATTQCTLLDGRTQDFNLMVRRDSIPARMLRINAPTKFVLIAPKTVAVYAMDTGVTLLFESKTEHIPPRALAWTTLPAGTKVEIVSDNALWMEIPV